MYGPWNLGAVLWSSASPNTSLTLYTFWPICNSGVLLVLLAASALCSLLSCVEVCASCHMSDNCLAKISALCVGQLCAGNSFAKDVSTGNRMFTPYSNWNWLMPLLGITAAL